MKKIKLFLAAMTAMFTMGVNAQEWTGNAVANGTFYLYNVGAQKYLNNGDPLKEWGTNAYLQAGFGLDVVIAEAGEGVYTIETNISNGGNQHYLGNNTWCDADPVNWQFRAVEGETNTYQIIYNGEYLMANEALNDVEMVGDPGSRTTSTYWKLVSEDDFKAAMVAKTYSATEPMDVSVFIKGRSFARNDGRNNTWVTTHNGGNWTWIGASNNKYYGNEAWNNTFDVHQEITGLPDGTYEVQCSGFGTNGTTYVYGNTTMGLLQTDNSTSWGNSKEAKWKAIHEDNAFAGQSSGTFTLSGGKLTVGIKRETNKSQDWAVWDEFRLYYYGLDLSEFAATLADAVNEARALSGYIPTAAYHALDAVVNAQNLIWTTAADYTAAAEAIAAATNTAKTLVAPYAAYKVVAANAVIAGVEETTIDEQTTAVNDATTVEGIEACTAALQAAIDALAFDITSFTIKNATAQSTTDWDCDPAFGAPEAGVCEYWNVSPAGFHQTVNLPAGTYRLTVVALQRTGMTGTVYAGENSTVIAQVSSGEVNSRGQAATWFNAGNGKNYVYFTLADAADVVIGLKADETLGDHWTVWKSFNLDTFQESVAAGYLASGYTTLVQDAQTVLEDAAYANVSGEEKTNLETAISAAPSTVAEYEAAVEALNNAVTAFKAAKTNYDIFATERTLADAISTDITVPAPNTAEDALVQFRALKVAEFNYVANAYPYSATSKIGEFSTWERTGTVNGSTKNEFEALTSQHWSGNAMTYYEQPAGGWGANAWTANYTKTTTLPAGNYVIKVAARAATGTGTVAKITCSAATLDGPIFNFGDTGKGITVDGVASFDEGTFAVQPNNGGEGCGWVWNYLPFTLDAETEVTMTVVAEGNGTHQWFSVCDGELLSKTNIATAVAYNDASANTITDVDVANVTISREIKADFNTVVLPFDLTAGQVQATFGAGSEVYAFSEDSSNPDDVTISFDKVIEGTISANVPVLVKATQASTEQVFEGVQVVAPTDDVKAEGTNFDFVGTYAPMTIAEGDYFIGNGALYKSAGSTNINAFRAYLNAKAPATEVKLFIGGEEVATGISTIENGQLTIDNAPIYNLAGQRIQKMQKGINIVNGKKIMK